MKKIILMSALLLLCAGMRAQTNNAQQHWLHSDLATDTVFGISTSKAYSLLKGKKAKITTVAVIDAGVETTHPDLKDILWKNSRERIGNGKDDDGNGYNDDIQGWNFLASDTGDILFENLELTRIVRTGKDRFESSVLKDTSGLNMYLMLKKQLNIKLKQVKQNLEFLKAYELITDTLCTELGTSNPSRAIFQAYTPITIAQYNVKAALLNKWTSGMDFRTLRHMQITEPLKRAREQLDYSLNVEYNTRPKKSGDYGEAVIYGNAHASGPNPLHGTHVAGIIAASRRNGMGIDGVADHVRIMVIRAVPEGDERDDDIARAIRYAVDNGARIINMSFGKSYSPNKDIVDQAVKYAMDKDVLIIHSAGNEGLNLDLSPVFPNRTYIDGSGTAQAWIEVGASGQKEDKTLLAGFSNYGKNSVDVLAPGVNIYSALPAASYGYLDGTSMAAPVVSGIAALLRSYFPDLTAIQVKEIIMKSVVQPKVAIQLSRSVEKLPLNELCTSGGVVNAYQAIKLASILSLKTSR